MINNLELKNRSPDEDIHPTPVYVSTVLRLVDLNSGLYPPLAIQYVAKDI